MKLQKSLLNTNINRFYVVVQACDDGVPPRCINTTVTLTVDRTGQPPLFTETTYRENIDESKPVGELVLTISATDTNQLGSIEYEVVPPSSEYFSLNSSSGEISLAKSVKDDLSTIYTFQVISFDSGEKIYRSTADVFITVTRNPNPPVFTEVPYRVTLDQNSLYDHIVVNTTATDLDKDIPRYLAVASVETMSYFNYDTDTGVLYLRKLLTSPTPPGSFELTVYARDQRRVNEKTGTSTISITVDFDSRPFFIPSSYGPLPVSESADVGTFVVDTNAFDSDINLVTSQMVYESIGKYPAEDYFEVNSTNGIITLKRDIRTDVNNLATYEIVVVAYDALYPNLRGTATATVTVNRNPNAPQFQPSSNYDVPIPENTTIGTGIVDIVATDQDQDSLTFEIMESSPSNGMDLFFIEADTGKILTIKPLTRDSAPVDNYNLVVQAHDGRGQAANASVSIRILRFAADIPPRFTDTTFNTEIRFDQPINVNFFKVNAIDQDLKGALTYELIGVYPAQDYFVVDPTNGQVSLKASLTTDPLTLLDYTLRVQAYDSAIPDTRAEQSYNVKVNRNPNAPRFPTSSVEFNIVETYPVGGSIDAVNATDDDGDVVKYNIIEDKDGLEAKQYFFINADTGYIHVGKNLTSSRPALSFSFRVRAGDQGKPEKYGEIQVTVKIDRDNNNPVFVYNSPSLSDYFVSIQETRPVNSVIVSVQATDADNDARGSIKYEAVGDGLAIAYFSVDPNNGNVAVKKPLMTTTETSFMLQIKAYHTFWPNNAAYANVNITVLRNVNSPFFTQNGNYRVSINEYYPFGRVVTGIRASDNDQDAIRYSILGPAADKDYFYINPSSGDVFLRKSPSKNPTVSQYVMTVQASDQRSPPNVQNATLTIDIIKNAAPTFTNLPGNIVVPENAPVNQLVYQVTALDSDISVTSGQITYRVTGDKSGPSFFSINSATGVISPRVDLRTDDTDLLFTLRVIAFDSEIPEMTSESTLTVNITRNQNPPIFNPSSFTIPITDQYNVGQEVGTPLTATDGDGDTLVYEIMNGPQDYFYLNPSTGQLSLTKTLGSTNQNTFTFQVSARDQRNPEKTDTATVTVTVDRDENIPTFPSQKETVSIVETRPVGDVIITLLAGDTDLRGTIMYAVDGIYPAPSFFTVNSTTGDVSIQRDLRQDANARSLYILQVVAYDSAAPDIRGTTQVEITVQRNVNPPSFIGTPYTKTISELHPLTVEVINITATDGDMDDVTYQIISDNNNLASFEYFYMDPDTGVIYLRKPLTTSTEQSFTMTVRATDTGNPSKFTDITVTLIISRVPPPTFGGPYSINVREDTPVGTPQITVTAIPPSTAPNANITYVVVGKPPAGYYFDVNENTGLITVRNELTTDDSLTYTLTVRAYDRNTPDIYRDIDIPITVTRNDNPPIYVPPSVTVSVDDDSKLGYKIIKLNATDKDNDTLEFSITGANSDRCKEVFYVIGATGEIYLNTDLRLASERSFSCEVTVTDNGYPSPKTDTTTIQIQVNRLNYPVFSGTGTYSANLREDDPVGKDVVRVQAFRTPVLGSMVYEVDGNFPSQHFFGVNSTTGQVKIIQDLRKDGTSLLTYDLKVVAYDSNKPLLRTTADVTINVQRNLNGPQFFPDTETIDLPVDTDPNFWSMPHNVSDPDSTNLKCSIISDAKAQQFFKVDPDTCVMSLKDSLENDPDLTTQYRVTIQVTDNGVPIPKTDNKIVIVNVPRDRFAPTLTNLPATVNISESANIDDSVYTIIANDVDKQGNFEYRIVGDAVAQTFFKIDPSTGNIRIRNRPLSDGLQRQQYNVQVEVIDSKWPNNPSTGTLTINVNRNPSGPTFSRSLYTRTLRGNHPVADSVIQLLAPDGDGDEVTFTSLGTTQDKSYFLVHPNTGQILLIKSLESTGTPTSFQFQVRASDTRLPQNTALATVQITVTPLAGPPVFTLTDYQKTIPISQGVNTTVETVQASDSDVQGVIRYNILGFTPGTDYFLLDPVTGVITLKKSLYDNPNINPLYLLLIEAYDTSEPDLKAFATVQFSVNRNEHKPEFQPASYTVTKNDYDAIGTSVVTVNAIDRDATSPEKDKVYSIEPSNDYFTIGPFSGLITINKRMSEDTATPQPSSYTFNVVAKDTTANPESATAVVTVNVNRNTAPFFIAPSGGYSVSVSEAIPLFQNMRTVQASDIDDATLLNGQIEYYFDGPEEAGRIFQINPVNGSISARIPLSEVPDGQETWIFTVGVRDKGIPPLTDTARVTVTIQRIGDIQFDKSEYDITIRESEHNIGDTVYAITASDPLVGSVVQYDLRGDGLAKNFFNVTKVGSAATIILHRPLIEDDNRSPTYTVRIVAYRESDPAQFAEAIVRITVIRNPNDPRFLHGPLTFTINEDAPTLTVVGQVNATDDDEGDNGLLTYKFSTQDTVPPYGADYFYINPSNGEIMTINNLRGDNIAQYKFVVIAQDGGVPRKQSSIPVTINIERNPSPPQFIQTQYDITINESTPINTDILQVVARDNDNDPLEYSIELDPPASFYFRIGPSSGMISTAQSLYTNEASKFILQVKVVDKTTSPQSDTATVTVNIRRNVYGPVFTKNRYDVSISEYHENAKIVETVTATDLDSASSSSGILRYQINASVPVTTFPYFTISQTTGQISLARALTQEDDGIIKIINQFTLTVVAKDISDVPKAATCSVIVKIVRNQFDPAFSMNDYTVQASDSMDQGTVLETVTAGDDDSKVALSANTPNAEIEFSVEQDTEYSRYFAVGPTGDIYIAQPLTLNDDPRPAAVQTTIKVCDKSWRPRCDQATLTVNLNYTVVQQGELGFTHQEHLITLKENVGPLPYTVKTLTIENQGVLPVRCSFTGNSNSETMFSVTGTTYLKNCNLTLIKPLDYERKDLYTLTLRVEFDTRPQGRKKRQIFVWNTHPIITVTIKVEDVNDITPQFIFPIYPSHRSSLVANKYFAVVTSATKPDSEVTNVIRAVDNEAGVFGDLRYSMALGTAGTARFQMDLVDASVTTTSDFSADATNPDAVPMVYSLEVRDQAPRYEDQLSDTASLYINTVFDVHRFILVAKGLSVEDAIKKKEIIRVNLQNNTGNVVLIENIEKKRDEDLEVIDAS